MAKDAIIQVRGEFKGMIFYLKEGKYFMRRKPAKVKQSKPTKRNSGRFGMAVKMSKEIRHTLKDFLPDKKGKPTMYRLNDAIYQWLLLEPNLKEKGLQAVGKLRQTSLNGAFGFTGKRHIECQADWEDEEKVIITIPPMVPANKIEAPAKTESVTLQLGLVGCQIKNAMITGKYFTSIELPYAADKLAAQEIEIPFVKEPGGLVLLVAKLQYHVKNGQTITGKNPLQWLPAGIVDAVYMG